MLATSISATSMQERGCLGAVGADGGTNGAGAAGHNYGGWHAAMVAMEAGWAVAVSGNGRGSGKGQMTAKMMSVNRTPP